MHPTAEIAKKVRTDVRAAVKAGKVTLPAGAKVSVRADTFSCGSSVDVTLIGAPEPWLWVHKDRDDNEVSPAARRFGEQMEAILRTHLDGQWGGVYAGSEPGGGLVLGSVARRGWVPGQD